MAAQGALLLVGMLWLAAVPQTPTVFDQYRIWGQAVADVAAGHWLHAEGSYVSGVGRLGPLGRWLVQAPLALWPDEWTMPILTTLLAWLTGVAAWRSLRRRLGDGDALVAVLLVMTQPAVWTWTRFGFDFAFLPPAIWLLWRTTSTAREAADGWRRGLPAALAAAAALQIHATAWPIVAMLAAELLVQRRRAGLVMLAGIVPWVGLLAGSDRPALWGTPFETLQTAAALVPPLAATWSPDGSGTGFLLAGALATTAALLGLLYRPARRISLVLWAGLVALGFSEENHYHHVAHLLASAGLASAVLAACTLGSKRRAVAWVVLLVQILAVGLAEREAVATGRRNLAIYALRPDLEVSTLPTLQAHRRLIDRLHAAGLHSTAQRSPDLVGPAAWLHIDPGLVRLADLHEPLAATKLPAERPLWHLGPCATNQVPIYGQTCLTKLAAPAITVVTERAVFDLVEQRRATWARTAPASPFPPRLPLDAGGAATLAVTAPSGWAVAPAWVHFPDFRIARPQPTPAAAQRSHQFSIGAPTVAVPAAWGWPLMDLVPVSIACSGGPWEDDSRGTAPCAWP